MKNVTLLGLCFALGACTPATPTTNLGDANSSFSFSSRPVELLVPYMEEVLLEMRDDYRNAVSLHDATRTSAAYGRQYALIEKYIEFLLPTIGQVEGFVEAVKTNSLQEEQYRTYTILVSEWREKSTTVFGAIGRKL